MRNSRAWGLMLLFLIAFWGWVIFIVKGGV